MISYFLVFWGFFSPLDFSHKSGRGMGWGWGLSRNAGRGSRDLCCLGSLGQSSPRAREAPRLNLSQASVFGGRPSSSSSLVCTCRLYPSSVVSHKNLLGAWVLLPNKYINNKNEGILKGRGKLHGAHDKVSRVLSFSVQKAVHE